MNYSIFEIARIVSGDLIQNGNPIPIHRLSTDSRNNDTQADTLFVAISGKQHNGHDYLPELYQSGIRSFLIEKEQKMPEDCSMILVKNSFEALQLLATHHRQQYQIPVIGVTGSNGKTIIKEWLYQLLREDYFIVRNPKSYNSQLGVPLSVLLMDEQHELGIFEAGISQKEEMEKLENILQPEIGILSNIGAAHSENFSSREEQLREKLKLFSRSKKIIFCADDFQIKSGVEKFLPAVEKLSWSRKKDAYLHVENIIIEQNSTLIHCNFQNQGIAIRIPFVDQASIENSIHCLVLCLSFQIDHGLIKKRFEALTPIEMRLELLNGINDCLLVNDTYNSDFNSLQIALDFLNHHGNNKSKTLILSDILQDKSDHDQLYSNVAELLEQNRIERIIGIGPQLYLHRAKFSGGAQFYESSEQFIQDFKNVDFKNELILLKGARLFHFEKITELLQEKAHETVMEINLNAISSNLAYFRSKLKPGTKIMAMVKAFSYGSGSAEIAKTLAFNRADYLAVAYADEGIELRNAGVNLPILVMNPERKSLMKLLRYHLEPEIYSFKILHEVLKSLEEIHYESQFPIHLKIDTGMHRLGFDPDEIVKLAEQLKSTKKIKVRSVFTHLASSDVPEQDGFTKEQLNKFEKCCNTLEDELEYHFMKHSLNSTGILRFPAAQMEMVRLGLGLYGISEDAEAKKELIPVSTLRTLISQIKIVYKGESVGYSQAGKIERKSVIATLPIGYADGYSRKFGLGNAYVLIHGKKAPTVGQICMDMCMVDITDIPEAQEGDAVLVFGKELPVEILAEKAGTISYEILSAVSGRVKRIYTRE